MTLWIILALMTLAVVGELLFSLLRKQPAAAQRVDYDVVVYRDQLAEIDKDVERGLLSPEQAKAAQGEIYRRMLAAEDAENAVPAPKAKNGISPRSKLIPTLALVVLVPLGAGLTYSWLGSPSLPGKPYAERKNDPDFTMATEAEQLAVQLENKPDAEGFKRLADIYFEIRRYDQAAEAYQKTIEMKGESSVLWSELGETIALAHDDLIVPEARQAFIKALRLDPKDARARFYLGLAETQINEPRRAVAIWKDLQNDSKPDSPWISMLQEHIASFAKEGGFDPESIPPLPPSLNSPHEAVTTHPPEQPGEAASSLGVESAMPSGDAATAIMAMPPSEQNDVIHKMVDHLADKLKDHPDDLNGWKLLATSYRVLGEPDKANEAEAKAAALKTKASDGSGGK